MEGRSALWAIAVLLLTSLSCRALAGSAAVEFGVHRHPVQPTAVVNAEPALCGSLVTQLAERFDSTEPDTWDVKPPPDANPVSWLPAYPDDAASHVGWVELDLDGDGHRQVLVHREEPFRESSLHYGLVFPTAAEFEAGLASVKANPPSDQYSSPDQEQHGTAKTFFPQAVTVANEWVATGNVWAEYALFEWRGHYYFFNGTTRFDRDRSPQPISLFQLRGDGHVREVCRVEATHAQEVYAKFVSFPGVSSYLRLIRAIGAGDDAAAGGSDCGTGNAYAGVTHDAQATASELRAALRPWVVADVHKQFDPKDDPYHIYNDRTERFLREWGLQDAWSHREYQTLVQHVAPAVVGVAEWLREEFAVSEAAARPAAVRVVHELLGQRLLIPTSYGDGEREFTQDTFADELLERDVARLDADLTSDRSGNGANAALAVEWAYGLRRLLATGADPDLPNEFGKTPLMVAAHMNRPDAVRALLGAGAKVNLATNGGRDPRCSRPMRTGRTALMYAAEDASPVVMKILLDAGADPTARDSQNNTVDFYLAHNPRLTAEQIKLGLGGVAQLAPQFALPGFDGSRARTAVEKAICGSEVLRVFDGELTRAYGEFRARYGEAAVAEQRAWLARRDTRCPTAAADFAECVAEVLRTRVRYLHNRLHEGTAPGPH
jgi:uncharacterized protein YecT (DUF1311 family)